MTENIKAIVTMDPDDALDLEWFFAEGLARFERSNMGSQLDRAYLYAVGSKKCTTCKGTRFTKVKVAVCTKCDGGWTRPQSDNENPVRCKLCEGRGVRDFPEGSPVEGFWWDEPCAKCNGRGVTNRAGHARSAPLRSRTVNCKASTERAPPPDPDLNDLERYGLVVRRLMQLSERSAAVLFAYHWVGGNYADDMSKGRLWPVQALTPAGRKLLKANVTKRPSELDGTRSMAHSRTMATGDASCWLDEPPDDWQLLSQPELLSELEQIPFAKTPQYRNRRSLLNAARRQAAKAYEEAVAEWMEIGGRVNVRRKPRKRKADVRRESERVIDARIAFSLRQIVEVQRAVG